MAARRAKLPFFLGLISGLVCCNILLTWIWTGWETPPKAPFTAGDEHTEVPLVSKENRRQGLALHVLIGDKGEWRMVPAIHDTWGRSTVYLAFHGPTLSLADEERLVDVESLRANAHVFYRNASLGSDCAYMSLLQDICAQKQQFEWVAIVKPTTYVLVDRLNDVLKYLDSADPVWLGRPDAADSSIDCAVCDDIGSIFSEATVSKMCSNLKTCSQRLGAATPANSSHLQRAVIVAGCLGVCCIEGIAPEHSHYMSQFFYSPGNLLLRQALQMGALDGNPHVESALIISGLERPEHVLNVHFYFVMLSKSNAAKMATLVREELLQTVHRLKEAGRREESASPEANPLWLTDHHLQPPSQERTMDEVIQWESFNLARKQAISFSAHSPVRDISKYELKAMMDGIVKLVPRSRSNLTASESVSVHRRLDPFRGIDYMVESCSSEGGSCTMHHSLQGFELPVITSVEETLATLVEVKFVVSSPLMSRAFHRFIMSFESSFLVSHSKENVGLLAVVSSDGEEGDIEDGTFAVSTILHLYKKKYPHVDFRMVLTESMPTPYEVARIASKEFNPSELIFILDVHLDVAALLPQHCRMMAREERAYAPVVFAPYNPAAFHWSRMELPIVVQFQVSPKDGFWLSGAMDAVCIYNSDLISVLDVATNQTVEKWSLSEAIKAHRGLTVFQSVDPGLAYMWHEQCAEKDRRTERQVCEELDKLKTTQMPN